MGDSTQIEQRKKAFSIEYLAKGYIDQQLIKHSKNSQTLQLQNKYLIDRVEQGNLNQQLYQKYLDPLEGQSNVNRLTYAFEKIIEHYQDNGYPFAKLSLKNNSIGAEKIRLELQLDRGQKINIDSIHLHSKVQVAPTYIYKQIGLQPGDLYSEKKLQRVDQKINTLGFVRSEKASMVRFYEHHTALNVFLKKARTSSFNGIVGILPDGEGKTLITGDVTLNLHNSFYRGEKIDFSWKRLQKSTQNLQVAFAYPYVFKSNFGIETALDIFRKDSLFSNLSARGALQFLTTPTDYMQVFVQQTNSIVLGQASAQQASTRTTQYGIGYAKQNLDRLLNPRKGFTIDAKVMVGNKAIEKLDTNLNQLDTRIEAQFDYYLPIKKRFTVLFSLLESRMISDAIFENELYRFGGIHSLRGYDEQALSVSSFTRLLVEPRLLLDESAALFTFFNIAFYERDLENSYQKAWPYGVGLGLNFLAKSGMFSFSYALNNNFSLSSGKVHFGFISYF